MVLVSLLLFLLFAGHHELKDAWAEQWSCMGNIPTNRHCRTVVIFHKGFWVIFLFQIMKQNGKYVATRKYAVNGGFHRIWWTEFTVLFWCNGVAVEMLSVFFLLCLMGNFWSYLLMRGITTITDNMGLGTDAESIYQGHPLRIQLLMMCIWREAFAEGVWRWNSRFEDTNSRS